MDDKVSFLLGYGADSLKIYAPRESLSVIKSFPGMTSLYVNSVCGKVETDEKHRFMPGEILADTGYAVLAGVTFEESSKYTLRLLEKEGALRAVEFTTPAGVWQFAANFGDDEILWQGEKIAPGACTLKQL